MHNYYVVHTQRKLTLKLLLGPLDARFPHGVPHSATSWLQTKHHEEVVRELFPLNYRLRRVQSPERG